MKAFFLQLHRHYHTSVILKQTHSLVEIGMFTIHLYEATRLLHRCYQEKNFARFTNFKDVEEALAMPKEKFTEQSYSSMRTRLIINN
jgi:hypothetical protein